MAEGEVAVATSREDRPLPAEMNWSGDGGALRQVQYNWSDLMPIAKNYFHDRLVLLLLSVNIFLTLLGALLIVLRFSGNNSESHIVQYRSHLGLDAFTKGGSAPIFSFILFSVLIMVFHTVLGMRIYHLRRQFSVTVLGTGTLLLIIAIIVSNALLVYR
ncbi:hypothetical protein HY003_00620 [Candidatus Saccharibacteria bacterium]|nr:hypothetical protein [Candidatus Saccharibacteria bacterium]MBI3337789.1 hypothetical protein [Candidatus Saccharibacteria bacterium]